MAIDSDEDKPSGGARRVWTSSRQRVLLRSALTAFLLTGDGRSRYPSVQHLLAEAGVASVTLASGKVQRV